MSLHFECLVIQTLKITNPLRPWLNARQIPNSFDLRHCQQSAKNILKQIRIQTESIPYSPGGKRKD